jgi:hypothetical protein
MLAEKPVSQPEGAGGRRWFDDDDFDLIVWLDRDGGVRGFQLCYDRRGTERALTWTSGQGYFHNRIDDGEAVPTKNRSPILVSDGNFDADAVSHSFRLSSTSMPEEIRAFVLKKLETYPRARA